MKAFNFDLSKFKKAGEDAKMTRLESPDGHVIMIAHSKLPPMMREQLKRLKMAKGGNVQKLADGTADGPLQVEPIDNDDTDQPNQSPKATQDNAQPDQSHTTIVNVNPSPAQGTAPPPQQPVPAQAPNGLGPVQVAQTPPNANLLSPDQTLNAPAAVNLQQQAAREQQAIDTTKGVQAANIERSYAQQRQALADKDAANVAELKSHTDDLNAYIQQNPIDPNHWAENQSVPQKIANAFGLLAGGFSKNGVNPAQNFINDQINRDIAAQKERADQQKTVWGAYEHLYGDENIANNLAKVSQNDIYTHKFNELAADLATPQAAATANAFAAQKAIENHQLLLDSSGRLGTIQLGGGSPQSGQPTNEMGQPTGRQDRILAPGAQQKYASLMYNPTTTPQQKSDLTTQYNDAVQADKALDQIDKLFPQLANKSTWGGALSEHIDPNAFGAAGAAAAEGLGAAGAIPTAGASLVGAVPGAILAGGAGKLIGEGLKTGARVVGGQQEEQYRTGVEALKTIVANALAGAKVTPTEAGGIVDQFIPTKFNSEETVKDKLEKLKQKIISITRTSALDNARMTNR